MNFGKDYDKLNQIEQSGFFNYIKSYTCQKNFRV